jgi:peptide/nickel transport system ATP-binding protein
MSSLIQVNNLKKYFQVQKGLLHAVDDNSFSIDEGETLGVVGESGCGKSTLGRLLLRLHEPTSGEIYFNGIDLTSLNSKELMKMRKHMQIIFQDPYASLNPRYTVAKLIEEPLKIHNYCKDKAARKKRIEELMEMVGLAKRSYNLYPHEFDGGKRQRIVIARALALNPKFIVCDEPVSALDVSVQAQILNLIMDLQKQLKLTYMFISHDLSVVKHISDHVMVMYLGNVIEKTSKQNLFANPMHPYTQALLSAIPSINVTAKRDKIILQGELSSPINPKSICRFSARCPYVEKICLSRQPELREVSEGHFVACHKVHNSTVYSVQAKTNIRRKSGQIFFAYH